jgi:hypothetical protein
MARLPLLPDNVPFQFYDPAQPFRAKRLVRRCSTAKYSTRHPWKGPSGCDEIQGHLEDQAGHLGSGPVQAARCDFEITTINAPPDCGAFFLDGVQRVGRNSQRVGATRRPMTGSAYCAVLAVAGGLRCANPPHSLNRKPRRSAFLCARRRGRAGAIRRLPKPR